MRITAKAFGRAKLLRSPSAACRRAHRVLANEPFDVGALTDEAGAEVHDGVRCSGVDAGGGVVVPHRDERSAREVRWHAAVFSRRGVARGLVRSCSPVGTPALTEVRATFGDAWDGWDGYSRR
jgi:hypothetical protein